jgi:hypothetical protein
MKKCRVVFIKTTKILSSSGIQIPEMIEQIYYYNHYPFKIDVPDGFAMVQIVYMPDAITAQPRQLNPKNDEKAKN